MEIKFRQLHYEEHCFKAIMNVHLFVGEISQFKSFVISISMDWREFPYVIKSISENNPRTAVKGSCRWLRKFSWIWIIKSMHLVTHIHLNFKTHWTAEWDSNYKLKHSQN